MARGVGMVEADRRDPIRLERRGAVAALLIDRASRRNALNLAMWETVPAVVTAAEADPAVRVIILRSAVPGIFSAGADIEELAGAASDPYWRRRNQAAIRAAQHALARADKPVIALIEGDCVGGGCGLAIACDLRVAAPGARLGITPARLGLVYSLDDTKLLVDLVGPSQAKRILFTGELLGAAEAQRIGLVDLVADDAAGVAGALAESIAAASPHSVRHAKRIVRRILDGQSADDADTLALFADAFDGADHREGVAAFLAKRRPCFGSSRSGDE